MSSNKEFGVPFQVQQIIDNMLNKKDNIYLRTNFKNRLDTIRNEISKAIVKFDNELQFADAATKGKKKRA